MARDDPGTVLEKKLGPELGMGHVLSRASQWSAAGPPMSSNGKVPLMTRAEGSLWVVCRLAELIDSTPRVQRTSLASPEASL